MKTLLSILFSISSFLLISQDTTYQVSIDLGIVNNDRLSVKIETPDISQDQIEYHMPKIVPGTYSISDFGRFVTSFRAVDKKGDTLSTKRLDVNRWQISNAKELDYISYWIDDTFDENDNYKENFVFEPGGTSIEAKQNAFVLNTFGLIGYLDGYKFNPYQLTISHSPILFGATSLKRANTEESKDMFLAPNYNILADSPIMYCQPDTVTKMINGTEILVSVFSPNGKLTAKDVMRNINDLMEAQTNYLGGKLPVDRYAYLVYLLDQTSLSGGMGALEHSYSSLYSLPEIHAGRIGQIVRDVAAHEFLHIVTPLNIHSEQIHNFNYIEPEMSQHLWLYEGVTEYSSMHVQVRNKLYDEATFLSNIVDKVKVASRFPLVSFTEMSKNILNEDYAPMYTNVYYKGALIAMCLDLYLINYSEGKMDLPMLMAQLAKKYGPNQAFEDELFLEELTKMTFPEVGEFFEKHVKGNEPLPLKEVLSWAGYDYQGDIEVQKPTLGKIAFGTNKDAELLISDLSGMNEFGKSMGYEEGDKLVAINGKEVSINNLRQILDSYEKTTKHGDKVTVEVMRSKNGKDKKVKLKAKAQIVTVKEKAGINTIEELSDTQQQVRDVWMFGIK